MLIHLLQCQVTNSSTAVLIHLLLNMASSPTAMLVHPVSCNWLSWSPADSRSQPHPPTHNCLPLTQSTRIVPHSLGHYLSSSLWFFILTPTHTHHHLYLLLWWNQRNSSRPRSILMLILWFSLHHSLSHTRMAGELRISITVGELALQ